MEKILRDKLIGEQLSSVEFVQDYLQLHFDGRTITIYVWPEIQNEEDNFCFGEDRYRNELCAFIGLEVKDLYYQDKDYLVLLFKETKSSIKLNLDPSNPDVVSEIAIFNDELDKTWSVLDRLKINHDGRGL